MRSADVVAARRAAASYLRRWRRLRAIATDQHGTDEGAHTAFKARSVWRHYARAMKRSTLPVEHTCLVAVTQRGYRTFSSGHLAEAERWARKNSDASAPQWRVLIAEMSRDAVDGAVYRLGAMRALEGTVAVSEWTS